MHRKFKENISNFMSIFLLMECAQLSARANAYTVLLKFLFRVCTGPALERRKF